MSDFLIDHALKNLWCTPDQDNQVILKPARITPFNGVASSWRVLWTPLRMPEQNTRFHLFQIGHVHPYFISLFPKLDQWVKFSDTCINKQVICDIYNEHGLQLPRVETWYIVTEERNIVIAIKENKKIPIDYNKDAIYLRIYQNEFYSSERYTNTANRIDVKGGIMKLTDDILTLQSQFESAKLKEGGVYCFRNGYKVKEINLVNTQIGDIVEFVYDPSIYKVVDFQINQLKTFDSEIDFKGKYLLHYSGGVGNKIDFHDDVDLFIIDGNNQKGIYYHKNATDAIRMVTHRDYSIPVPYVASHLQKHAETIDNNNAYLRLHVRYSGYARELIDEQNQIKELYKLDDTLIRQAMIGVNSNVNVWKASQLEKSNYCKLMGLKANQITKPIVTDAYGYHSVSNLVATAFKRTYLFSGQLVSDVPYLYQNNATVFEYNTDGKLVGYYYHANGHLYNCTNNNIKYVEFVHGNVGPSVDDYYDVNTLTLNLNYDYRFYVTLKDNNAQIDEWFDVTNEPGYYVISGNSFTWLVSNTHNTLIRSNQKTLVKNITLPVTDGIMMFNISHSQLVNGTWNDRVMEVPMGELDIFLNGYQLTENLDYYVKFPTVTIINKEYIQSTINQNVILRFKGLCQKNLSRNNVIEHGFVVNETLSVDHRFDLREGKNIGIFIDGKAKTLDELKFNENNVTYTLTSDMNGKPYCIKDIVAPLKSMTQIDTYDYRNVSKDIDREISDYLTLKIPQPLPEIVNPIMATYKVFSPFISRIIAALQDGDISDIPLKQQYNDNLVRELVAPYLYLLDYDPLGENIQIDENFVRIHPHPYQTLLDMDIYHYTFVNRVLKLYGKNKIDLSSHTRLI